LTPDGLATRRDFERWLREHGFSRARAKELASHGWQDAQQDDRDAIKLLRALASRLELGLDSENIRNDN